LAHSRCHHRFCGLCRLGRRREAKSATGLKSHSIAHVLPRPTLTMLPERAKGIRRPPNSGANFGARHRNEGVTFCPHPWRSGFAPGTIELRVGGP
jgi:hypothetical protein